MKKIYIVVCDHCGHSFEIKTFPFEKLEAGGNPLDVNKIPLAATVQDILDCIKLTNND